MQFELWVMRNQPAWIDFTRAKLVWVFSENNSGNVQLTINLDG